MFQINGERNPAEVYNDFRVAVLRIIGSQRHSATANPLPNGKITMVSSHAHGGEDIYMVNMSRPVEPAPSNPIPASSSVSTIASVSVHQPPANGYPPLIYVIGKAEIYIRRCGWNFSTNLILSRGRWFP